MAGKLWARKRRPTDKGAGSASDALMRRVQNLEEEGARAQEILDRMEEGMLALSETLTPLTANEAARKLLDVSGQALPPRMLPDSVQSMARRAQAERMTVEDTVNIWPVGRKLRV